MESSGKDDESCGIFESTNHKSISVIACDTKNVKNMAYMFNECKYLENLNISKIDTSNVTNMSFMFFDCNQIQNLNISNFNVENVNDISSMFRNCRNLQTLNFKHFDDFGGKTLSGYLFNNCKSLTKIEMDDFNRLRHFAKEEEKTIFVLCDALIDECKKKLGKKDEITSIDIVSILKKRAEEEKQKMKEE